MRHISNGYRQPDTSTQNISTDLHLLLREDLSLDLRKVTNAVHFSFLFFLPLQVGAKALTCWLILRSL